MILADSEFFLALMHRRDALHKRARAWGLYLSEPMIVTEYVLWETVNASSRPRNRPTVHKLLTRIRDRKEYEVVPATTDLFKAGLALHAQRPDKEWSLTDCISFVVMKERGITRALAHDHHFEQAGFEALLRRDPT